MEASVEAHETTTFSDGPARWRACFRPSELHNRRRTTRDCKYAVSDSDADHATARAGFCIGFIDGFQQFEQLVDISQGANDANSSARLICTPDGVTNRQNVKVVVKYLDRHPEFLHKFAAQLVLEAMQEAFPCPKARDK